MPKILHPGGRLALALDRTRAEEIAAALRETGGDIPAAAEALGVGRKTLYEHIERLGLRRLAGLDERSAAADRNH